MASASDSPLLNGVPTEEESPNGQTDNNSQAASKSSSSRFKVAPVSVGKGNKDEDIESIEHLPEEGVQDARPTKVGFLTTLPENGEEKFADGSVETSEPTVGVKFAATRSDNNPTITSQHSKISDTIGPYDSIYQTQKTYGAHMTEAFPHVGHYRNLLSATADPNLKPRPTLQELHGNKEAGIDAREAAMEMQEANGVLTSENPDPEAGAVQEVQKFGWIVGVLIRCLLNIWGVMLFLRLSWVVGEAGIGLASVVVLLAAVVTTLTTISMSAISTNGVVKGGGAYFMISRSLGPEFGGAIGLIFSLANAVGVAMYIVGFAETIRDIIKEKAPDGGEALWLSIDEANLIRVIGVVTAVLLLIIVIVGLDFEAKMQIFMLIILILSIVDILIGSFIPPMNHIIEDDKKTRGFAGYSSDLFLENFGPKFTEEEDFFSVFSIFFPAATGILAGANISGDLKDAQSAIPKGTLLAIILSTIVYIGLAWIMGASVHRCYLAESDVICNATLTGTLANNTKYGLLYNYQVAELISAVGPIVTAGIFAATLSSALASLVGAPKVFQAVCKDRIFPKVEWFGVGVGANDEPRRAYFLCFVISVVFICIGDLNAIAPIISNFFLMAYCLINYSCFDASLTNSPGWRPAFKYYSKWLSLIGAILCLVVMFIINWWTALLTFAIIFAIWLYVRQRKPNINWGSSTQAHVFKSALQSSLELIKVEEHVKNYRPQVLLLCGKPFDRPALIDFCNTLTKGNSLLILGNMVTDETNFAAYQKNNQTVQSWLKKRKVKAFYQPMIHDQYSQGVYALMQSAGLGKLKPNLVFMGYSRIWLQKKDPRSLLEHFSVIHYAFDLNYSVAILRTSQGFDFSDVMDAPTAEALEKNSPTSLDETGEADFDQSDHKVTFSGGKKKPLEIEELHPLSLSVTGANTELLAHLNYFRNKQKPGFIDVWWLYDDGGLTLLLPYILHNKKLWEGNKLRIFSVGTKISRVNKEQQQLSTLIRKFRIPIEDVIVLPDIAVKPSKESVEEFNDLISNWKLTSEESQETYPWKISEEDLKKHKDKTNNHLRIRELLLDHSCPRAREGSPQSKGSRSLETNLIVLTLPIPRKNTVPAALYMSWLEFVSRDVPVARRHELRMPPFLFLRGNQTSVLTYYS